MMSQPTANTQSINFIEAVRYWERCRIIYNLVLLVVVGLFWGQEILAAGPREWTGALLVLLVFAGAANVLYSTAYFADLAFQWVGKIEFRQSFRWSLFAVGLTLAVALEIWIIVRPGMA